MGSFTLHVQLELGFDVFQKGWDGSQPLRRFVGCKLVGISEIMDT